MRGVVILASKLPIIALEWRWGPEWRRGTGSTRLPRLLGCRRPGRHGRGGSHGARIWSPRLARSRYQVVPALQGAIGGAGRVEGQLALRIGRHGRGLEPSWSPPASPPLPARSSPPPRPEIPGIVLPCWPPTGCERRRGSLAEMPQSVALPVQRRVCRAIAALGSSHRAATLTAANE